MLDIFFQDSSNKEILIQNSFTLILLASAVITITAYHIMKRPALAEPMLPLDILSVLRYMVRIRFLTLICGLIAIGASLIAIMYCVLAIGRFFLESEHYLVYYLPGVFLAVFTQFLSWSYYKKLKHEYIKYGDIDMPFLEDDDTAGHIQ